MNFSRSLTFAMALAAIGSAQAGWNRSPYAEERPVDLATSAIPGTSLVSSAGLRNAQSLIDSKISDGVILPAGKSSAVIQLNGQQNIHTAAFNNDGAEGKVTISGSADNKDWSVLGSAVFAASERVAQIYFAAATVKYVTISFDSAKGGTIRSFEVFGDSTDRDYVVQPKDEGQGGSAINLAAAVGGARAIYAFPTPASVGELNSLHSVFKFPRSRDKYRTIVYDLGSTRTVKDFAASYSQRPMRVEVFAFDGLIEKRDWRGKLTLDPSIFNSVRPIAVGEDAKGVGHIRITPDKVVSASYIALRFEQDYQNEIAVSRFNVGTQDLLAATAAPVGTAFSGLAVLPEFRFTASQGAGSDLMVGAVEFQSGREYEVTRSGVDRLLENSRAMLGGNTRANGSLDPYISAAFGSSTSTLHRTLPGQSSTSNPNRDSKIDNVPNTAKDTKATKLTVAAAAAGKNSAAVAITAPYVPGEAGSAESKLVKSFSNKFDPGGSNKNNHGKNCDHCYYCNRSGRCGHCGGHDDDHDSDHDGHDDDDHGGHGGGNDHDDHGNDHGPPVTG